MFNRFVKSEEPNKLKELIDKLEAEMDDLDVSSDEFSELMARLEKLYEIRREERPDYISLDTVAVIAGNLAGILLIVAYEHKHVMNSKGFGQLLKPRGTTK